MPSDRGGVDAPRIYRRTWRFWCDGCTESGVRKLTLDEEREQAIEWVKAHDGHGLGGFITPVTDAEWCEDCHAWHHPDQYQGAGR